MVTKTRAHKKNLIVGETIGLLKKTNEDSSGFQITEDNEIACICDGHWGDDAALIAKNFILTNPYPKSKETAISFLKKIEKKLFDKYGKENMDPEKDFTPETSVIAIQKKANIISIISYGDCRLIVVRNKKVIFELKTLETWLGAFSWLGLRNRISVEKAIIFKQIICNPGDVVMFFSDGVDECKYGTKTLSVDWLAEQAKENMSLKKIVTNIFTEIEKEGAEDNATLGLMKISND